MSWQRRPFDDLRAALSADSAGGDRPVRLDLGREQRTGAPELILAERKSADEVVASLTAMAEAVGRATATRVRDDQIEPIERACADRFELVSDRAARAVTVATRGRAALETIGKVGILTAGSSDYPVAAEAAFVARALACEVVLARDVGVAGLHRLVGPLERMAAEDVHAIIVAAGMDGALPSVVAGLVPVPVIGLPVSSGYGHGGQGEAALSTMLQSCSPGLVVVNIDNGVGAAIAAVKIARVAAGHFLAMS